MLINKIACSRSSGIRLWKLETTQKTVSIYFYLNFFVKLVISQFTLFTRSKNIYITPGSKIHFGVGMFIQFARARLI